MKRTTTVSTAKIVAIGATIAVTLLALLPGAWSTAVAQTAGTATPTPTATATATTTATATPTASSTATATATATPTATKTPVVNVIQNPGGGSTQTTTVTGTATATVGNSATDGGVSLSIPAASMPAGSTVTVTAPPTLTAVTTTSGATASVTIAAIMNLEAVDSDGDPITEFAEPVTVRVNIPEEVWATVLANTSANPTVKVSTFNVATGTTTVVECTVVNMATGVVDCALPHFSQWALEVGFAVPEGTDPGDVAPSDTGSVPVPADTGTGVAATEQSAGTNIALLLVAVAGLAAVADLGAKFALRRS
jgi:hypothetical protein